MENKIESIINDSFAPEEAKQIKAFLKRGFSVNGEIAISSIFLYAKEHGKSVEEVLKECEKEWKRNWSYQHPEINGDPNAPGGAGINNRRSLETIYRELEIPSPLNIL